MSISTTTTLIHTSEAKKNICLILYPILTSKVTKTGKKCLELSSKHYFALYVKAEPSSLNCKSNLFSYPIGATTFMSYKLRGSP